MQTGTLEIDVHVTRPVEGRQPDIWLTTSLDIARPMITALTPAEARELALLLNEAAEKAESYQRE